MSRNADRQGRYRASTAHALAYQRAAAEAGETGDQSGSAARVEHDLAKKYSPEQIAGRLRAEFPDQPEMWVSTETIYQSLYVQSRGALRRELTSVSAHRAGVALTQPQARAAQEPHPRHDQHQPSDQPRSPTGRCPAIGRAT